MGKNNCYWYPSEFYANWNIRNILCACHKYNETELNGKLEEKKYSISQGGSLAIRNQRITKKNNRVSIMAGLYTTGLGNANTRYNGGSIPAEIAPPGSGAFPAIVTKDNWTLIGIGCVIIETNGAITYQIDSSFQKDTYIWLDVSYDL